MTLFLKDNFGKRIKLSISQDGIILEMKEIKNNGGKNEN